MTKTTTFTSLAAVALGATLLHSNLAFATMSMPSMSASQMSTAMNAPAQQATASTVSPPTSAPAGAGGMAHAGGSAHFISDGPALHAFKTRPIILKAKPVAPLHGTGPSGKGVALANANALAQVKTGTGRLGALPNSAKPGGAAPQAAAGTIYGNGKAKGGSVPGFGYGKAGFNSAANLPGANSTGGAKTVPGIASGLSLNLPGAQRQDSPQDALNTVAAQENAAAAQVLDAASQGPDVNVPSEANAAQAQADGLLDSIANLFTGGGSDGAAPKSVPRTPAGQAVVSAEAQAQGQGQPKAPGSDPGGVDLESLDGSFKTNDGRRVFVTGWVATDQTTGAVTGSMMTVGPVSIGKGKKMPGDDSTGPVDANAGLALNNPLSAANHGGGTDNNVDQAGPISGQIAAASSLARKNFGDSSNDAGENHLTTEAALADTSALATSGQGDGGTGDDRGGTDGHTTGKLKVSGAPGNGQFVAMASRGR